MQYELKIADERLELYRLDEQGTTTRVELTDILNVYPSNKVYALDGKMGAGKTTFTKALCEAMGTTDVVNSPTFAIVNSYDIAEGQAAALAKGEKWAKQSGKEIYHFDCYRLKDIREAIDFGAEEYLYSGCYCFIEWPDIIEPLLPDDTIYIRIEVTEDGKRLLTI